MASCPSHDCCLSMVRLHVSGKSKAWLLVSGYLSKLLVNGKLSKARLLVQVEAACQGKLFKSSSHSYCEAWEHRDLRVCLLAVLRKVVILLWSYIDFGDILVRNGIFVIMAGSNHLLLRCYAMVLGGLTISHLVLRVPTVLDFSPFYLASFAVAPPSNEAVRKTERLCAEGLCLLFHHQQHSLHSSLHLLLPLLHA